MLTRKDAHLVLERAVGVSVDVVRQRVAERLRNHAQERRRRRRARRRCPCAILQRRLRLLLAAPRLPPQLLPLPDTTRPPSPKMLDEGDRCAGLPIAHMTAMHCIAVCASTALPEVQPGPSPATHLRIANPNASQCFECLLMHFSSSLLPHPPPPLGGQVSVALWSDGENLHKATLCCCTPCWQTATSLAFVANEAAACPHAVQHGHVQQVST